jgi:hypothetical protein
MTTDAIDRYRLEAEFVLPQNRKQVVQTLVAEAANWPWCRKVQADEMTWLHGRAWVFILIIADFDPTPTYRQLHNLRLDLKRVHQVGRVEVNAAGRAGERLMISLYFNNDPHLLPLDSENTTDEAGWYRSLYATLLFLKDLQPPPSPRPPESEWPYPCEQCRPSSTW